MQQDDNILIYLTCLTLRLVWSSCKASTILLNLPFFSTSPQTVIASRALSCLKIMTEINKSPNQIFSSLLLPLSKLSLYILNIVPVCLKMNENMRRNQNLITLGYKGNLLHKANGSHDFDNVSHHTCILRIH